MKNLKQTRKVGVSGGFINQMMGNNQTIPKVGEGATILMYSDRNAYEVIWVSPENDKCKIRPMNCKFIGIGYGDERYSYSSDLEAHEINLEYNYKKNQWQSFGYNIEIIKSLKNKLYKQYGYGWTSYLPNGLTYDDLIDRSGEEIDDYYRPMKLISGVTKEYKVVNKISIIFGVMEQYRDPSF